MEESRNKIIPAMLVAGLLAGTLDILAAIVLTIIYGGTPTGVLRFIASGAFGPAAFEGGSVMTLAGLFFHYLIAFFWTALFFILFPKLGISKRLATIFAGLLYGIIIWLVMNLVVLPATKIPSPHFSLRGVSTGIIVLMIMVGLPVSLMARNYYKKT